MKTVFIDRVLPTYTPCTVKALGKNGIKIVPRMLPYWMIQYVKLANHWFKERQRTITAVGLNCNGTTRYNCCYHAVNTWVDTVCCACFVAFLPFTEHSDP